MTLIEKHYHGAGIHSFTCKYLISETQGVISMSHVHILIKRPIVLSILPGAWVIDMIKSNLS